MLLIVRQCLLFCYILFSSSAEKLPEPARTSLRHPLHLSSTEINHNPKTNTLEISSRVFTDDFEDMLSRKYKIKADLLKTGRHQEMDQFVAQYILAHLQLAADSKNIKLNYLGFENDQEAIIIYLESNPIKQVKSLELNSTILYDLFDDQTNIFHFNMKGKRKSAKLDYPSKKLIQQF